MTPAKSLNPRKTFLKLIGPAASLWMLSAHISPTPAAPTTEADLSLPITTQQGFSEETLNAKLPPITPDEFSRRLGGPTRVTLHLKNVSIQQAIAELSRAAKIPIKWQESEIEASPKERISVDVDNADFWVTVKAMAIPHVRLVWHADWLNHALTVWSERGYSVVDHLGVLPSQQMGCFSLMLSSLDQNTVHSEAWRFGGKLLVHDESWTRLQGYLFCDPKLVTAAASFWSQSGNCTFSEITDSEGQNLTSGRESGFWPEGDFPLFKLGTNPKKPSAAAPELKLVRGYFSTNITTRAQNWDIPLVKGGANASKLFPIQGVKKIPNKPVGVTFTCKIKTSRDSVVVTLRASTELPYWLHQLPENALYLEDAKGQKLPLESRGNSLDVPELTFYYHLPDSTPEEEDPWDDLPPVGPPVRLHISIPLEVRRLQVPFEFHNLPLPGG